MGNPVRKSVHYKKVINSVCHLGAVTWVHFQHLSSGSGWNMMEKNFLITGKSLICATNPFHLAPPRADYEQAFAGANFNTEIVSGAPLRSPEHIF